MRYSKETNARQVGLDKHYINHERLMEMLSHDIADKPFLKLINKWLKSGIMTEENIVEKSYKGTPQGGVISPILANIYFTLCNRYVV